MDPCTAIGWLSLWSDREEHAARLGAARRLGAHATAPLLSSHYGAVHSPAGCPPPRSACVLYAFVASTLCGHDGPTGGGGGSASHPDAPQPPVRQRVAGEAVWPVHRRAARRLPHHRAGCRPGGGARRGTLPNTTLPAPLKDDARPWWVDRRPRRRCAHLLHVRVRGWGWGASLRPCDDPPLQSGSRLFFLCSVCLSGLLRPVPIPTRHCPGAVAVVRPPAASHPPRASRWGVDGTVVCVLHRAGSCRGGLATPALGAPSHRPSQGLVASCWPRYARTTRGVCGGWLAGQPRSLLEPAPWRCGSASRASSSSWCLQPFCAPFPRGGLASLSSFGSLFVPDCLRLDGAVTAEPEAAVSRHDRRRRPPPCRPPPPPTGRPPAWPPEGDARLPRPCHFPPGGPSPLLLPVGRAMSSSLPQATTLRLQLRPPRPRPRLPTGAVTRRRRTVPRRRHGRPTGTTCDSPSATRRCGRLRLIGAATTLG